ncbi:CBS domain-containing protein [Desulfitibacter alkalitolerans]|uniref:CBS domain-containing protein n=1 Tax=Desulfitibacter alkalitolerans TaxID=264641 RepID=UPI0004896289|nr:CBS domain-containing protein [Desulfitibacter alkalitolerans]
MQVIISHLNLDFDGLASMVAAGKLYPKAKKILPERLSLSVQQFLALYKDSMQLFSPRQIDWHRVEEVIIVDTGGLDRVGYFKDYLKEANLIIYDHHQSSSGSNDRIVFKNIDSVGATVTLLIEQLQKNNITISAFEATIMALGLYTDTGSFCYANTSSRDLHAAAYLLEKGANLGIVSRFSERPLLGEQQNLFNSLMVNSTEFNLKGLDILIAWHRQKNFQGGLSLLASKILEVTGVHALFLVVEMSNKIFVVGRSNTDMIDIQTIVAQFGGGGHSKAASASIKNGNYLEILETIKSLITKTLKPSIYAKDIMSSPVKTVSPETSIEEAAKIMLRYGHTGLPVVKDSEVIGIISRRDVDKAAHHGLGHAPVKGFMSKNVITISKDTSMEEIQNTMIDQDVGRLPVIEDGKLIGIVSRTDVLNYLHGENIKGNEISTVLPVPIEKNVQDLLEDNIPPKLLKIIKHIAAAADIYDYKVYMVGGIVRDLLLGYPSEDIDIVVDGDAIEFAEFLAKKWGGRVTSHKKFGTAKWKLENGVNIDLATARREYYDYPAALPTVERSSLKEDLYRRDFTINAMAIKLSNLNYGVLIDHFHGYRDLQQGKIRILYNLSFVEDPTRILRAVRFEQRFGFAMDSQTLELAQNSVELIESVSNPRIANELKILFRETNVVNSIRRLNYLRIWYHLFGFDINQAKLTQVATLDKIYKKLGKSLDEGIAWICYLGVILYNTDEWIDRLNRYALNNFDRKVIKDIEYSRNIWIKLSNGQKITPGFLHKIFKKTSFNAILFMATVEPTCYNNMMINYLKQRTGLIIPIQGLDLKDMGIKPGPIYKLILAKLEEAYLDGKFRDKDGAKRWVREYLASNGRE